MSNDEYLTQLCTMLLGELRNKGGCWSDMTEKVLECFAQEHMRRMQSEHSLNKMMDFVDSIRQDGKKPE